MRTRTAGAPLLAVCFCALAVAGSRPAAQTSGPRQGPSPSGSRDIQPGRTEAAARVAPRASRSSGSQGAVAQDAITSLLQRLEQAIRAGDVPTYEQMLAAPANDASARFARSVVRSGATRVVVRERARMPLAPAQSAGVRLAVDVFCELGRRAQLSTWTLDLVHRNAPAAAGGATDDWAIKSPQLMSPLTPLYSLALGPHQYAAKDLVIAAEDLELRLPEGAVFVAETDEGPTALVLVGRGRMVFRPTPEVEREQMRIFAHAENIDTPFTAAFVRLSPYALKSHITGGTLTERPASREQARVAEVTFRIDSPKSYGVDLSEVATGQWSLLPGSIDFLAEVHTERYGVLSYARSPREAEDISVFDRAARRNISLYSSRDRLAERGRFYDEDDAEDFDIIHYDIEASIDPLRQSLAAVARVTVEVRAASVSTLNLRLAESLSIDSVVSREFGRLLSMRVMNQNSFLIGLPKSVTKGTVLAFTVSYHGHVAPQMIDREAVAVDGRQEREAQDVLEELVLEPSYLYSNRSYWYPQSETSTYATATLRLKIPSGYSCVASGDPEPPATARQGSRPLAATESLFRAVQPVRYLSVLITRLQTVGSRVVDGGIEDGADGADSAATQKAGVFYRDIQLDTFASPRMRGRAQAEADRAADVLRFYSSLVGDCPYPTMALAVVERELPGGHSPAYLAVLSKPVLASAYDWRNDPTNFPQFPEFFIAHEIAHQWWGQAVGWKNYHEQWLSEGLSQYFAALYAERLRGKGTFDGVMKRMADWAMKKSAEGPVYLGYRIGHVKREPQLFRAIVYNKSAAVLHMLRRLIGDDAFVRGLRRFYQEWRFKRAGSDDLRRAFEVESGRPLARFFDRWIYDSRLPQIRFSWRVTRNPASGEDEAVLHFEQVGEVFDLPITVTLECEDAPPVDVLVPLWDQVTEMRVPVHTKLRAVEVNDDRLALARIVK